MASEGHERGRGMSGARIVSVGCGRALLARLHVKCDLCDRLREHCRRHGVSMSAFGRDAIREKLDRDAGRGKCLDCGKPSGKRWLCPKCEERRTKCLSSRR